MQREDRDKEEQMGLKEDRGEVDLDHFQYKESNMIQEVKIKVEGDKFILGIYHIV